MTGEQSIHLQLIAWLRKNGFVWSRSMMHKKTSQTAADPDFAIYRSGKVCFVELKFGRGKASPAQVARFRELSAAGCPVAICRSAAEAVERIQAVFGSPYTPETPKPATEPGLTPKQASEHLIMSRDLGLIVVTGTVPDETYVRIATGADKLTLPGTPL